MDGQVSSIIENEIATLEFFHPKKNSLPGHLLRKLAREADRLAQSEARVIVLRSGGEGPFCAGASFDELASINSFEQGKEFFMGFARLILALKRCPQFVIARVQGKAVGGGVGLAAAADYAYAVRGAAIRLSELALGIGPFVVGPCVERKIGHGSFAALSIDTGWRDAQWALERGLYAEVFYDLPSLDQAVNSLAGRLAASSPEAMARLKQVFWQGTEHWEQLLPERAAESGRLVLSDFTREAIREIKRI